MIIAIANTTSNNNVKGSSVDPDAAAFFSRVTTAGGTLTATEQTAVDTLVKSMKSTGVWASMKAVYPMVGSSAAACAQNLKSASFTATFSSGWTFESTGVTPNGGSAFIDTSVNMLNNLSQNNSHVSVYSRTNADTLSSMIGVCSVFFEYSIILYPRYLNTAYVNIFSSGGGNTVNSQANSLGFRMLSRTSSAGFDYYNNTTKTSLSITSVAGTNANIYVGANNNGGTAANFDSRQNAFTSIGDGLNTTQATDFYNAVQAFQTTLGRQV